MRLPKFLERMKTIIKGEGKGVWAGSFKMGDHIKTGRKGTVNGVETGVIVGVYKPNLYMVRLDKWTDEQILLMGGEDQAWIVLGAHEIWHYEPEYDGLIEDGLSAVRELKEAEEAAEVEEVEEVSAQNGTGE